MVLEWSKGDVADRQFEIRYQANGGPWLPLGKTSDTRKEITGLTEGVVYRFKIQAGSGGGWAYSDDLRTQLHAPLDISGFRVLQPAGEDTLTLEWDDATLHSIVDEYNLQYRQADQESWLSARVIKGGQTRYRLDDLEPAGDYVLRLNAGNEGGVSEWILLSASTVLPVPTGLIIKQVKDTSITVSHKAKVDYIFNLSYRIAGADNWQPVDAVGASDFQIRALQEDTPYEIRARYALNNRYSGWSKVLKARTEPPPLPANVAQPIAAEVTTMSARMLWSPKDNHGEVESYEVQWKATDSGDWLNKPEDAASYVLDGLQPYSAYDFKVRAINKGVKGIWSPQISFRTQARRPPQLQIGGFSEVTHQSVQVNWLPVDNEHMTAVEIEHQQSGGQWEQAIQKDADASNSGRVIIGLQDKTPYIFRLRAINYDRKGEWSENVQIVTSRKPIFF